MGKRLKQVDDYISKAAPFAQPILKKLRTLFHKASAEVDEAIKWGVPHFEYKGLLGGMAGFKQHVGFGFWKSKLMSDPAGLFNDDPKGSMCAAKVRSKSDLPPDDVLLAYIREAIALNEDGTKLVARKRVPRPKPTVPPDVKVALRSNKKASATFEAFSSSHQREYLEWITSAKQVATRERRLKQAIEWLSQGKSRNWKYER